MLISLIRKIPIKGRPTITPKTSVSIIIVSLSFVIAVLIRLFPAKYGFYLDEFDPYFHYYATNVIVQDVHTKGISGLLDFFNHIDTKFWYPEGRNFATSTYAGMYYFSALIYLFITSIGIKITLYEFLAILPAFMGAAIVIPFFLIGRKLGGVGVGGMAASLAAIAPGYLPRSSFGWYDNEPFALFFGFVGIYFLILMLEEESDRKKAVFSILAAIFIGFSNTIWGGARFFGGVIGISLLFLPFIILVSLSVIKNILIFVVLEVLIAAAFPKPGIEWFIDPSNLILYLGVLLNIIYLFIKIKLKIRSPIKTYFITSGIIIGGLLIISFLMPDLLTHRYLSVLNPFFRSESPIVQSVAEHQITTGIEFLYNYGVLIFFSIIGGYALLRKKKASTILIALLFLFSLYFSSSFARLQVDVSLAIAIASAYGIYYTFTTINKFHTKKKKENVAIYYKTVLGFLLVVMVTISVWYIWIPSNDRGTQLACSATILSREKIYDWIEALSWIKENIPKNSIIVSWWDYGYWISVIGNRTTVADNATTNTTRIERIALMYLSNESRAVKIMKELKADYVLVFVTGMKVGYYDVIGRVYSLGGDESKFDWMIAIAGLNRSEFIDVNSMPNSHLWNDTLIGKLMPYEFIGYGQFDAQGNLKNITKTFNPNSRYIQIPLFKYVLKYNENSEPFQLVFRSSAQLHQNNIYAQVLIYKLVE